MNQVGTLEKKETRGQILLRKYHAAKGILLPRLSDDEEALFPKAAPEIAESKPGVDFCIFGTILLHFGVFIEQ
jgi:hypothetical protein